MLAQPVLKINPQVNVNKATTHRENSTRKAISPPIKKYKWNEEMSKKSNKSFVANTNTKESTKKMASPQEEVHTNVNSLPNSDYVNVFQTDHVKNLV